MKIHHRKKWIHKLVGAVSLNKKVEIFLPALKLVNS